MPPRTSTVSPVKLFGLCFLPIYKTLRLLAVLLSFTQNTAGWGHADARQGLESPLIYFSTNQITLIIRSTRVYPDTNLFGQFLIPQNA